MDEMQVSRVSTSLDRWKAELLDLSRRNRLLYFGTGRGYLRLVHPDTADLFEGLVNRSRSYKFYLPEELEEDPERDDLNLLLEGENLAVAEGRATGASETRASRPPLASEVQAEGETKRIRATLYRLRLRSRSALVEQGTNLLFVAFGLLDWAESTDSRVRVQSPLLLVPVRLDRKTELDPYQLVPLDEGPTLNPALTRKLLIDFGLDLRLPEEGEDGQTLEAALDCVRRIVAARRDWSILPSAHLGLFSFAKYVMYADLEENRDRFTTHPLVRALAGEEDGLPEPLLQIPSAEELDARTDPSQVFQVLDADASQQEAIEAVKAGASLIIQGPPGTGKSQTITNIIAESLAQGKTVLFVSEKMAALRVVAKRLAQAGLGDFCLEAHSQDVNKGVVIRELESALMSERHNAQDLAIVDRARLPTLRDHLNGYANTLHDSQNPLGKSAYQAHAEISKHVGAPVIAFTLPEVARLTPQRLGDLITCVQSLARVGEVLLSAEEHPWHGCLLDSFTPELRSQLDENLRRLESAAEELAALQTQIRLTWGLSIGRSLASAKWLSGLLALLRTRHEVPAQWFRLSSLDSLLSTADEHRRATSAYTERRSWLLQRYSAGIFACDLEAIRDAMEAGGAPYAQRIPGDGHPADRVITRWTEIQEAVGQATVALRTLGAIGAALSERLGVRTPITLSDAERLQQFALLVARDPRPERTWFNPQGWSEMENLMLGARERHELASAIRAVLRELFEPEFFEDASEALAPRFEENYAVWYRALIPAHRRDMRRLRGQVKGKYTLQYSEALEALRQLRRLRTAERWLEENHAALTAAFGRRYTESNVDWDSVTVDLATIKRIVLWFGATNPPPTVVDMLVGHLDGPLTVKAMSTAMAAALSEARRALEQVGTQIFIDDRPWGGTAIEEASLDDVGAWLNSCLRSLTPLREAAQAFWSLSIAGQPTVSQMTGDANEALALREIEVKLQSASSDLQQSFGHLFTGLSTSWDAILEALSWVGAVLEHFAERPQVSFVDILLAGATNPAPQAAQFAGSVEATAALLSSMSDCFAESSFRIASESPENVPLMDVAAWARSKRAQLPRLEEWTDSVRTRAVAEKLGIGAFVDGVVAQRIPPGIWLDAFLRQVYALWLTWRYSCAPALATFRRGAHEDLIAEFGRIDKSLWRSAAVRIADRLRSKRPIVTSYLLPNSEPAKLVKEAAKRRRFRPLRKLFADLPTLLPVLKPCMLMSPLSVAQFLGESAIQFGVVVFDEASQILPADAIGAIGRGRQVVVVGDQKQLPPTRFFAADGRVDGDNEDEELPESILDACLAASMPRKQLRWHYRSRHEDLIAFSNRFVYARSLITFPSPGDTERAVNFEHVQGGVYDRGSTRVNRIEAARVADLVVEQVTSHPERSLGVITFSEAQMFGIKTELRARKLARKELEDLLPEEETPDGFFVKNLEAVQGDERDAVIFSVGYGPDAAGKMRMEFGPLNREGGERRLNVAVTRARFRVTIVASFRPEDIELEHSRAQGVHLLRRYMEFAERGPIALLDGIAAERGEPESPFEQAVADALDRRGLRVVSQVGVGGYRIDLGIRDEASGRYLLGVECDGATYHSSKTARDRDRLREEVLRDLGWRICRIWSTDWIKDPEGEANRVVATVEQARQELARPPSPVEMEHSDYDALGEERAGEVGPLGPEDHTDPRETSSADRANPVQIANPYRTVRLEQPGTPDGFPPLYRSRLVELVGRCVDAESPVHVDRVMRTAASSYGIARVGSQVRQTLLRAVEAGERQGRFTRRGDFLWRTGMTAPSVRALDERGNARPIREVAPEELDACLIAFLEVAFSMNRSDLITAIAREFGYNRTGDQVAAVIGDAVDRLVKDGALINLGGQMSLRRAVG